MVQRVMASWKDFELSATSITSQLKVPETQLVSPLSQGRLFLFARPLLSRLSDSYLPLCSNRLLRPSEATFTFDCPERTHLAHNENSSFTVFDDHSWLHDTACDGKLKAL